MPTEFPFEESSIPNPRFIKGDDAPFTYREEDDGRLWDLLTTYADGEATEAERTEVEALLRSDAAYAQDLALLQKMNVQMRSFAEVEPPVHLRDAILSATTQRTTFSRRLLAGLEALRATLSTPVARYAGTFATAALLTFAFWPRDTQTLTVDTSPAPPVVAKVNPPKQPGGQGPEKEITQSGGGRSSERVAKVTPPTNPAKGTTGTEQAGRDAERVASIINELPPPSGAKIEPKNLTRKNPVAKVKSSLSSRNKVQSNGDIDQKTPAAVAVAYGPRPMMDKDYQRSVEVAMKTGGDDSLKIPDYQPDDSSEPRGNGGGNNPGTPNEGQNSSETGPRTVAFRSGGTLPAISRRYMTGADLKREHEATTLGYTRSTVLSIQRSELTGNVVGRF